MLIGCVLTGVSGCNQINSHLPAERVYYLIFINSAGHIEVQLLEQVLAPGAFRQDLHDHSWHTLVIVVCIKLFLQIANYRY
jgi:hypothetical protein